MFDSVRRLFVFLAVVGLLVSLEFYTGCSGGAIKAPKTTPLPTIDQLAEKYVGDAEKMAKEGQFKSSNFFYQKAIARYEVSKQWEKAIKCYIKMGDNFQRLDDNRSALENLNVALQLTKNFLGFQPLELAKSFQKLAFKHLQGKNLDMALKLYRQALGIQLEVLGEFHPEVAKTYNSIALVYLNKNNAEKARKNYIKSYGIKLRQFAGVPEDIRKKYRVLGIDMEKFKKGEFRQAREHFRHSIEAYQRLYGNNNPLFADIYAQIGMLFAFERDFDNAMQYLRRSLSIRLEAYGDNSLEAGESYLDLGICLRLKGDYTDAFSSLLTSLTIKEGVLGKHHPQAAEVYFQLGQIHYQLRRWNQALLNFQESLMALVPGFTERDYQANPPLDNVYSRAQLLDILSAKARALKMRYVRQPERMQDLRWAYSIYLKLVDLVEMIRQGYKSESYKLTFGEKSHALFQEAIQNALLLFEMTGEQHYKEEAFVLSEKSKAAVLSEALSEARARRFAGIPEELLEEEDELKSKLTFYDTYLEKEYQKKESADAFKIKKLEEKYYTLLATYREMISGFERNYQKYYDLKYRPVSINIPGLQRRLGEKEAVVEYFVGEDILHIFVMTGNGLHVESVPLEIDLAKMVGTYYRSIKKIEEEPFYRLSHRLYRLLFEPVHRYLQDKKKLIVIPDGSLYYVPFESLAAGPNGNGKHKPDYLIKHFTLLYHYSANLWLYSLQKEGLVGERAFIGFAPVFGSENREGYVLAHDPGGVKNLYRAMGDVTEIGEPPVSQLPATEEELQSIIHLFKNRSKRARGYFHKKATETAFKAADLTDYNLIHIATHSMEDVSSPKLAGLVFAPPAENLPGDESDDGILYSGEIYNLKLDAELIVLSSCESGVGKLVKGEGMMALNRGFFYSGTRSIMFSLWKVEDRSTSRLMIAFYRNILDGLPFSLALREAKLKLLENPFTAFPKYWSGFLLVGR
jgi:CHAT domain-containing protein